MIETIQLKICKSHHRKFKCTNEHKILIPGSKEVSITLKTLRSSK
uniref:Uncharacterized protein n=1 Tax=Rhizophora mucronata TaxID=61149 RepID=A0A2P2M209_RHIMU